ncbi:hypothetical protein O181_096652 [Austropuccinia psidii MF-1]|uniref:Reverse transcriptase Ty1/copia-type domain-containing protein n=1 Tax=Austropuccinia psidii MF-1 TaxID=1389203 RepID=A0A9Q3J7P6_9BASI|nr:hypothetical protein [Austropuccinia psidii MF-1]
MPKEIPLNTRPVSVHSAFNKSWVLTIIIPSHQLTGWLSSLQTLISFSASNHFQFHQMDVKSAFLNSPIKDSIALEIQLGLALNKDSQLLQLNKALYRMKQSPLAWHNYLLKWLAIFWFTQ